MKDEQYFRGILTPEQFRVMRERGTETSHTGKYWESEERGIYVCAACSNLLFLSLHKFDAENGWPAFRKPPNKSAVVLGDEGNKKEVACKRCESHLGYLVSAKEEKPFYQINSIALDFKELPEIEWEDESDDSNDQNQNGSPQSSGVRNLSLTIGGLTIGAALGAGAMYAATPTPLMCQPSAITPIATSTPIVAPATTTPAKPKTTPTPAGTSATPVGSGGPQSSARTSVASASAPLSTTSSATSSRSGGAVGTSTP